MTSRVRESGEMMGISFTDRAYLGRGVLEAG